MQNKLFLLHIAVFVTALALVACDGSGDGVKASCNPITDARDGQSYCTVTIGSQTWMSENLNYAMEGSYCYADDPANCAEFGRLYTYDAALRACPAGWHIPTRDEWWTLAESFNLSIPASQATGYENWPNATDSYGFSVRPGGLRDLIVTDHDKTECDQIYEDGCYRYKGFVGYFRVVDNDCTRDDVLGCTLVCVSEECSASFLRNSYDAQALSVRCIKGEGSEQTSSMDTSSFSNKSSSSTAKSSSSKIVEPAKVSFGSMTDARDGQTYKTVTIGKQTWMAENLNYEAEASFCLDLDGVENSSCTKYGRIYGWAAAIGKPESECGYGKKCSLPSGNVQGVCPDGWHLPSKAEWASLLTAVGGSPITGIDPNSVVVYQGAGTKLKTTSGWDDFEGKSGNGTDNFGFTALSACDRIPHSERTYCTEGLATYFWSSTEHTSASYAYYMVLTRRSDALVEAGDKRADIYVRCIQGNGATEEKSSSSALVASSSDSGKSSSSSESLKSSSSLIIESSSSSNRSSSSSAGSSSGGVPGWNFG